MDGEGDQNVKVYYRLDTDDIKQLIAEKYGISTKGISRQMTEEGPIFMADMSKTETPAPVPFKDYVSPFLSKLKEEPAPEQKEPEPTDEDIQELKYKQITDEVLKNAIKNGLKVADICKEYCLTDKKYAQRLYVRIAKFNEGFNKPMDEESKALYKRLKKAQEKREDFGITVYTCPVCGKEFNTEKYPDYAYKKQMFNQKHIFCGYDCMRKAEKLNP